MEPDPARSHHPDTKLGKKAYFVTTLVKGAARNYGESADERKGKRIHFRNRDGVLYEFRNSQGFIQYTCVDCEKRTPKKYTLVYIDQSGCYTKKDPEDLAHSCQGQEESGVAVPGNAVDQNDDQPGAPCDVEPCSEHMNSSTAVIVAACSSAGIDRGPPVTPGVEGVTTYTINSSSKETFISQLEYLLQELPEGACMTLPVSHLQSVLAGTFYLKLYADIDPTATTDIEVSLLREFLKKGKSTFMAATSATSSKPFLMNSDCSTTTTTSFAVASACFETTSTPSTSKQAFTASKPKLTPQTRTIWRIPSKAKRIPLKKCAGKAKPKQQKPPAARKRRSKVDEDGRLAQLERKINELAESQEKFQAHMRAMLTPHQIPTTGSACVSTRDEVPLMAPLTSSIPAANTSVGNRRGETFDTDLAGLPRTAGADCRSMVGSTTDGLMSTATIDPASSSIGSFFRGQHLQFDPRFGNGSAVFSAEQQWQMQAQGQHTMAPGAQVSSTSDSQHGQLVPLAVHMPMTFSKQYLPQNEPSSSNTPTGTAGIPLNVPDENEPILPPFGEFDPGAWDEFFQNNDEDNLDRRSSAANVASETQGAPWCLPSDPYEKTEETNTKDVPNENLPSMFEAKMRLADGETDDDMFSGLYHDAALDSKTQPPRQELRPDMVVNLLELTVGKIICSEVIMCSPDRSKLDHTIQTWHGLGKEGRAAYDCSGKRIDTEYSQKELEFIAHHLTELVPSAVQAHRKADWTCYHTLLDYIWAVIYSWYISYDFDAIPWIRKLFCTPAPFPKLLSDDDSEVEASRSIILPGIATEAHLFKRVFIYAMPLESIQCFALERSEDDNQEKTNHFDNMRKLYNILWSDNLLSQESFPSFHTFITKCLEQDRRQGSNLVNRMVLRRTISAVVQHDLKDEVRIRNLLLLRRILIDSDCNLVDINGFGIADYARKFGNTSLLELLLRIESDQGLQQDSSRDNFSRERIRLARGLDKHNGHPRFQYGDRITGLLWDNVEPELQRPFELCATIIFLDPDFVEFKDWRFEPRLIHRVLRADVSYLNKSRNKRSNAARSPRDSRRWRHARPFHLVLDPGKSGCNEDGFEQYGTRMTFRFGRLVVYFVDDEFDENAEDLFLLDYTITFGSSDRPGPTLRFLRIVEMISPLSGGLFKIQQTEEKTWNQQGVSRSRARRPMSVLSFNSSMKLRPYLEVRGTAIPIYSPLKELDKLLEAVHGKSEAFPPNVTPMQELDRVLNLMTANGWTNHIQGSKRSRNKQEDISSDASQPKPITEVAEDA